LVSDGTFELELRVTGERSFPGIDWRIGDDGWESFFVRPHQVGNPDAIQYTPAFHGVSAWQLYTGEGFSAPVAFPLDEWFTIRVVCEDTRAEMYVADLETPVFATTLRVSPRPGEFRALANGDGVELGELRHYPSVEFRLPPLPHRLETTPGAIRAWEVSNAFREGESEARAWAPFEAEPSGLLDLARANPLDDGHNTAVARATIYADSAETRLLEFGFSDRVTVSLNGRPLFRGSDGYRTRDYRFLGSIGGWDAVWLPLQAGANELAFEVSEGFGGWGVQARLVSPR
jgi:hypothetical protein